jgi:hypothetical protein
MRGDGIIATSNGPVEASQEGAADPGKAARSLSRDDAVRGAHRVLTVCLPGKALPTDLSRLRAMLDAHMFGGDKRALRDDAVRVARQIDSLRSSRAR